MAEKLWIVDGHSLIYRAMHASRVRGTQSLDGRSTKGVAAFLNILTDLLDTYAPDMFVMTLDVPRSRTFRRAIYPDYKVNRNNKKQPLIANMREQVDWCAELCRLFGFPVLQVDGFEADDTIASLVDVCSGPDLECVIVSRDKDLMQLIGPHCRMYNHHDGVFIDEKAVEDSWGVPPSMVVDVQTLMGDACDNVPGVPKFGKERAIKYVRQYGSLDNMLNEIDMLPKWASKSLTEADLDLCRQLVELRKDVPLKVRWKDLKFNGLNYKAAGPLLSELGINNWIS